MFIEKHYIIRVVCFFAIVFSVSCFREDVDVENSSCQKIDCNSQCTRAMAAIKSATLLYIMENKGSCPKINNLKEKGYLLTANKNKDTWGRNFEVLCNIEAQGDYSLFIFSRGKDGVLFSKDDFYETGDVEKKLLRKIGIDFENRSRMMHELGWTNKKITKKTFCSR